MFLRLPPAAGRRRGWALPCPPLGPAILSLDKPGEPPLLRWRLPFPSKRKTPPRRRQAGSFRPSRPRYAGPTCGTPHSPSEPRHTHHPLRHDKPPSSLPPRPPSLYPALRADWLRRLSVRLGISRGRNRYPPPPPPPPLRPVLAAERSGTGSGAGTGNGTRRRPRLGGALAGELGAVRGLCRP